MKLLIASDIHGDAKSAQFIKDVFESEKADNLVLLGDVLYHGPRNDLPSGYNPKQVIEILNSICEKIICVRGNCDAEVDQMVLDFAVTATYMQMNFDNIPFFITHGHIYDYDNMPKAVSEGVFIQGHTHIPVCEKRDNLVLLNPGSTSIPKGGFEKSYMIYENKTFTIRDFSGNTIFSISL